MPLKTFVKASGINNLSDARYFSVYPVDWLSYNCNINADNYITLESIQELHGWVEGPKLALEVETLTIDEIQNLLLEIKAEGIQVSEDFKIDTELKVFRRVNVREDTTFDHLVALLNNLELQTDYLLLDFNSIKFHSLEKSTYLNLSMLQAINEKCPVIVNNIHNLKEVETFLFSNLFGLDIAGGNEEKAGIRSFEDIQDIMDALEEWD